MSLNQRSEISQRPGPRSSVWTSGLPETVAPGTPTTGRGRTYATPPARASARPGALRQSSTAPGASPSESVIRGGVGPVRSQSTLQRVRATGLRLGGMTDAYDVRGVTT